MAARVSLFQRFASLKSDDGVCGNARLFGQFLNSDFQSGAGHPALSWRHLPSYHKSP